MLKSHHGNKNFNKKSRMRYEWRYGLNTERLHDETERI